MFDLGPLFVKKRKGFLKNLKIDGDAGTSMPRAQPVVAASLDAAIPV